MTLIDLGDYKIRFDPKEVRISIDGEMIDIGARINEEKQITFPEINDGPGMLWSAEMNAEVSDIKKRITQLESEISPPLPPVFPHKLIKKLEEDDEEFKKRRSQVKEKPTE